MQTSHCIALLIEQKTQNTIRIFTIYEATPEFFITEYFTSHGAFRALLLLRRLDLLIKKKKITFTFYAIHVSILPQPLKLRRQ